MYNSSISIFHFLGGGDGGICIKLLRPTMGIFLTSVQIQTFLEKEVFQIKHIKREHRSTLSNCVSHSLHQSPHTTTNTPEVYSRGGVCTLHGPGALQKWKPKGRKTIVGADGKKKTIVEREYYFVCDLAPQGRKKLTQTRLSFVKTTRRSQEDTMQRDSISIST